MGALAVALAVSCAAAKGHAEASSSPPPEAPSLTGLARASARGKALFVRLECGGCHTLRDAGGAGQVGPVLDDNFNVTPELVTTKLRFGGEFAMPPFGDRLTEQEMADLAAYVTQAAQGPAQ